jgi:hypothetical protein
VCYEARAVFFPLQKPLGCALVSCYTDNALLLFNYCLVNCACNALCVLCIVNVGSTCMKPGWRRLVEH